MKMKLCSFCLVSRILLLIIICSVSLCASTKSERKIFFPWKKLSGQKILDEVDELQIKHVIASSNRANSKKSEPGGPNVPKMMDSAQKWIVGVFQMGQEGCTLTWKNFQKANAINKKMKAGETVTYAEYMISDQEKADRGKIFSMMMSAVFFPEWFPIMLVMNPAMLPSPFLGPLEEQKHKSYEELCTQRAAGVLEALTEVSKLSLDKNKKKREQFQALKKELSTLLRCTNTVDAYVLLEKYCVAEAGKSQRNPDVSKLPQPLYRALVKGLGIAKQFYPRFATNFELNDYMKKVAQGDEVLFDIPVEQLSRKELLHACSQRAIGSLNSSNQELQKHLSEYLDIIYDEASDHLNPHHTRIALIGIHMVQGLRQSDEASLPRMAFTDKR